MISESESFFFVLHLMEKWAEWAGMVVSQLVVANWDTLTLSQLPQVRLV